MNTSGKTQQSPLGSQRQHMARGEQPAVAAEPAVERAAMLSNRSVTLPATRPDTAYQPGIVIVAELAFAALLLYLCNQPINPGTMVAKNGTNPPVTINADAPESMIPRSLIRGSLIPSSALPSSRIPSSTTLPNLIEVEEFHSTFDIQSRMEIASSNGIEIRQPAIR